MSLVKKVQNTCYLNSLLKEGDKIVLGVSGGPDSVCMLDIFARLQKKCSLELIIAHVNYGLRGNDSEKDEEFVRELAEKYSIAHKVYKVHKVEKIMENALRDIRYEFFEKVRRENKFDAIAVAHNADDQAETFLMRVIRGAGLQGLASMQFKNGKIIRPLLATPRAEILEYLQNENLNYRTDRTNLESKFLRNKIRNKLIPYIEKNYNPNIRKTIFDATVSIAQDYDFISGLEKKILPKFKNLEISKLLRLHPAMQSRVLRQKLKEAKGNLKNISAAHIEEILKVVKSTKNKPQVVVLSGLKIKRKGDKLEISNY